MKKIAFIFLSFSLVLQSFAFGFLFPIKIVHAGTLSTSIFPSSISGMSLIKKAVQAPHGCYAGVAGYGAQEFVVAAYTDGSNRTLATNVGKYNTSGSAENIAKSCMAELKAQVGSSASWVGTRNTTVSGYKAIYDLGSAPGQGYAGIIHVIVNEYLIALTIIGGSSVSESDLKSASAVLVSRLPQASPSPTPPPEPSKKDNGQYCRNSSECRSGYCYNNICCASGKECCTQNNHCREAFYCDTSLHYCVQKKLKGASCQVNSECQSNYCGYAGSNLICCTKGPMGICCKTQSDCGGSEYCFDYGCRAQEQDGSQCGYNYECKSGYCEGGKCKTRPRETQKMSSGYFCKRDKECNSGNCENGICCEAGKTCCVLNHDCEKSYSSQWWECAMEKHYCVENVGKREAYEKERARKDGYCFAEESCYTPDCEHTVRCGINEACAWGGEDVRGGVGCLASVASELNIVAKAADIIQGIGCDIIGKFISGVLGLDYDKIHESLVSIVYTAIDIGLEAELLVKMLIKVVACIDGYFGISKTFLINIAYALTEVTSAVSGNQTAMVALESPAGLIVKDNKGRSTGISAAGITHSELPNSVFVEFPKSDLKLVFLTDTGGDEYEVITRATAAGTINVKTARSDGETIEKMDFNDITQDSETQTDLAFKTKVGSGTVNMEIPLKGGGAWFRTGQLSTEKVDETKIPEKFRAGRGLRGLSLGGFSITKIFKFFIGLIVLLLIIGGVRRLIRARKTKWGRILIVVGIASLGLFLLLSILSLFFGIRGATIGSFHSRIGFFGSRFFKILICFIVLFVLVGLFRRKELLVKIFKRRKESVAEKLGVKKEEEPRTRKSIIVNTIKFIIYFILGSLAILVAVSTINSLGPRALIFAIPLTVAGAAALYLAVKLVKDRKLSLKHLAAAILVLFIIGAVIFLLLFLSQSISR